MEPNGTQLAEATVFVVEDDEVLRIVHQSMGQMMGLASEGYRSAEDFLAAYHPAVRGLMLLDMDLRGMSGLQLQAELKRRAWEMPIVFMTAPGAQRTQYEALRQGAVLVLEKPCKPQLVIEALEKAIELMKKV